MAGPVVPTTSPFITQLGSFSGMTDMYGSPMMMFAHSILTYVVAYDFLSGTITTTIMVYLGDIFVLIVQLCSAAYLVYKTTDALVSFSDGLAHIYRRKNIVANYMGQYEIVYGILFFATPLGLTMMALYGAMHFWDMVAERETAVADEGFFGVAVSNIDAIKLMTLGLVVAVVTYYSSYSIGETLDELIGWFDKMDDHVDDEATNKINGSSDTPGTSIITDLQYHGVTVIYTWFIFTFMILGSNMFAMNYGVFKRLEDCNLDDVDESYYEPVRPLLASQVDLSSCKAAVKAIFKLSDLDSSLRISRCENAKFLYGMGNSSEYALMYNEVKVLPMLYESCAKRFPVIEIPETD